MLTVNLIDSRVTFPVEIVVPAAMGDGGRDISVFLAGVEAENLIVQLENAVSDLASRNVVQVQYVGKNSDRTYAYTDPGLSLKVGDLVVLPPAPFGGELLGRVVGTGRNGYDGPLKSVVSRLVEEKP